MILAEQRPIVGESAVLGSARFLQVLREYQAAKRVPERLLLETLEEVLPK